MVCVCECVVMYCLLHAGVRVEHTLKCVENVEEPSECLSAKQFQLSCFISQGWVGSTPACDHTAAVMIV